MSTDITQLTDEFLLNAAVSQDPEISISKNKRLVSVIDSNGGSYTSGAVSIDAKSALTGTEGFASIKDGYLIVPYAVSVKNTGATNFRGKLNPFSIGMKTGIWNIIDRMSVEINGKQIITENEFALYWNNLRAQFSWSYTDVETNGASAFMHPDETDSIRYKVITDNNGVSTITPSAYGDGYHNTGTNANNYYLNIPQNDAVNLGYIKRLKSNPPQIGLLDADGKLTTGTNTLNWRSTRSGGNPEIARQSAKGGFAVLNSAATAGQVAGVWVFMCHIRLRDLHPLFDQLDLCANPQLKLNLRFNQGVVKVKTLADTNIGTTEVPINVANMQLESSTLFSSKTCPILISSAAKGHVNENVFPVPSGENASGFSVAFGVMQNAFTPTVEINNYLPFTTTRLYLPFYDLVNPSALISKPVKKYRYLDVYAQMFDAQPAGVGSKQSQQNTTFNYQLSPAKANIKAVCLLPFANTSQDHWVSSSASNITQYASPFDTAPWTVQPGSYIQNFQVQVGSSNVFTSSHSYDFETFMDQFSKIASVNGGLSHEISNGLIDARKWSQGHRVMVADVSRMTSSEIGQSLIVSGVNASTQGCVCLILVIYERSVDVDRLTGEVVSYTV